MNKFLHHIIKISYVEMGVLPDIPYHLISDDEMLHAFFNLDDPQSDYFHLNYPLPDSTLTSEYQELESCISNILTKYSSGEISTLPDWIYSYMLGVPINNHSSQPDRHMLLTMLGCDNIDDIIILTAYRSCYEISKLWLAKYDDNAGRVPSMFGEPHVVKSLRLQHTV